jgi:hypothetical protein
MYSDSAIAQQKEIKFYFNGLTKFYNEMLGNFAFSHEELLDNMGDVLRWIEKFNDYKIIIQEGTFFLTNFED